MFDVLLQGLHEHFYHHETANRTVSMVQSQKVQFRYDRKEFQRQQDHALFTQLSNTVRSVHECHIDEETAMRSMWYTRHTAIPSNHVGHIRSEFLYISMRHVVPKSVPKCSINTR